MFNSSLKDFFRFATLEILTEDIDPVYPVLQWMFGVLGLDSIESRLWGCYVYLSCYDVYTTWVLLKRFPVPTAVCVFRRKLSIGTERRHFRGAGKLGEVLCNFKLWLHGRRFSELLGPLVGGEHSRVERYKAIHQHATAIPYIGPWARFKFLDLLQQVVGIEIEPYDIGEYVSPYEGFRRILKPGVSAGVETQERLLEICKRISCISDSQTILRQTWDYSVLETICCKFGSMAKGHYYVGRDVDHVVAALKKIPIPSKWEMVSRVYPKAVISSISDRLANSGALQHHYIRTGKMYFGYAKLYQENKT